MQNMGHPTSFLDVEIANVEQLAMRQKLVMFRLMNV